MMAVAKTELGAMPRRRRPAEMVPLAWPSVPSERARTFEEWQGAAMPYLRATSSDFAVAIGFRKLLQSDGRIWATNAELAVTAGCSAKTLEIDIGRLRKAGLIIADFRSMKGFSGHRRVIRLSLPSPDDVGGI